MAMTNEMLCAEHRVVEPFIGLLLSLLVMFIPMHHRIFIAVHGTQVLSAIGIDYLAIGIDYFC